MIDASTANEFISSPSFAVRMRRAVSIAWEIFGRKVGGIWFAEIEGVPALTPAKQQHRCEQRRRLHCLWHRLVSMAP
jgi:hypothetical protein